MNNPAIKQTLIELEESLSKIESARNQVNNVSEKSEKLIRSFNDVLKSIESLSDGLGIEKGEFKSNLDKSFKNLDSELKKVVENTWSSSNDVNRRIESIKDEFLVKLNETSTYIKEFEKNLSEAETRINKIDFNSKLESIAKLLEDIKSSLASIHTDTKNYFKSELIELENRLNKKHLQNLIIMGIGFIAIIIIILVK